jgi:penicillin-binding protein 2
VIEPGSNRTAITPALALRVAVLGGLALVLFAIIFFRLWYLQVLSGDHFVSLANENRVRDIRIQAPRGAIVDRNGNVLVDSRQATAVQVDPSALPKDPAARLAVYEKLAHVIDEPASRIQALVVKQRKDLPYANVTIKTDVDEAVRDFLSERQTEYPGVVPATIFLRKYPEKTLAAHLVGTVGEISPEQLKEKRFRGVSQGTIVGKGGVEWWYDRYLRGRDGAARIQVNSLGQRPRDLPSNLRTREPISGKQLKLSLDLDLQREGQRAMAKIAGPRAGGFVALDPRNGQVLALGSYPTFDPSVFTRPLKQSTYESLTSPANNSPLVDRAVNGLYPTGSTFKPITALAALQAGVITPDTTIVDGGCVEIGAAHQKFCNAGEVVNGPVALRKALQVSSDVYFFSVGRDANGIPGQVIQKWARRLGLGHKTGIDLPDEGEGLIPDRAWRAQVAKREMKCRDRKHIPLTVGPFEAARRGCGISDMRPWTVGDNVNLAVGQGDLQANPLQMAVAYSAIVNGGRVVKPHLGLEIDDAQGRLIERVASSNARRVHFDAGYRQAIMDGLHAAASEPGGTSADVFKDWNQEQFPVYGKTGTAERPGRPDDQSWYVCYASNQGRRPIVIAVTIEDGGFGAEAAAPAARLLLAEWFHQDKKLVVGHSHTR